MATILSHHHLHCRTHDATVSSSENITDATGLDRFTNSSDRVNFHFLITFRLEVQHYPSFLDLFSPFMGSFCSNSCLFVRYYTVKTGQIFTIKILIITGVFELRWVHFHVAHLMGVYWHIICYFWLSFEHKPNLS